MKNKKGITLISLIITIVVLIILSTVAISLTLGNNGILNKAEQAKNETIKQTAIEKINLKITNMQIEKYTEEQRMPTLQEFTDGLCEDDEIQYVQVQSKKVGSLSKIEVGEANSIFTKLKEYPYEFEINSSLQLASIDGVQLASNDTITIPKDEYDKLKNANTYSTEEKVIGTWIDGKPLYRKMLNIDLISEYQDIQHGIENVDTIMVDTSAGYFIRKYDNSIQPVTCVYPGTGYINHIIGIVNLSKTTIGIFPGSSTKGVSGCVFLKYTKTTDNAN